MSVTGRRRARDLGDWIHLALTGQLEDDTQTPSIRVGWVTFPAMLQVILFCVALGISIFAGAMAFPSR